MFVAIFLNDELTVATILSVAIFHNELTVATILSVAIFQNELTVATICSLRYFNERQSHGCDNLVRCDIF